ncbi:MAG: 4-hydroxy-3-methylbut-2-enyl diphosphate reductase [Candidatus Omnitrophica bacterium CG1_02_44_16]|nr:MAG: 4-hydroxy-3-methylbut-2-enyl diphosphate reductase [Candidatus Omnitrophica bacterium CG1_02_44_16]PIY82316.1 MAG: 4-hydroxy-3-methylbut-2-enyl diphosphate reductase [Candidatus Omnitrophica bacterium CG_4_10_14_0_8_um_filter_44_12]PIZ83539.1 MAG: 4-hydroxy-3-methylbut-2-enyl diphosphate reductase [Candidatus Omnitrophica bacterium CG_4_10_14_0_2_um_filter_44_9]
MKINLARSAGFCFGVKRAIDIAYRTLLSNKNVYMLGNIVHNEKVAKKLKNAGLKKTEKLNNGKNKILLIRAHGASLRTINKARKLGYRIVDATCPMVKEIHRLARQAESEGRAIIVIGDKKHDEVRGIIGQLKIKAIVISGPEDVPLEKIKKIKKAAIVAQSTQNIVKVLKIAELLRHHIRDLKFFNTICQPTRTKQQEMQNMPLENDAMIIIGSKASANTQRLYEISRSLNARSYWVRSKKDIKPRWFKEVRSVGITAGASTPNDTTKEIVAYIKKIA